MRSASLFTLAASAATAFAQYKGFNYGSTNDDGSNRVESDFENQFNTAKALVGTSGFTSARLYTMIQGGTTDTVISAIPAAISSETTLLLGLWASAGQADFDNELTALKNAISQYGTQLAPLIAGISVGSEDLYRITPTGIASDAGAGAEPSTLVDYISQVRSAIAGTALSGASIGHVDTWTAWVNGSNSAVIDACDWVGMDAYPYFQNTMSNAITDGASLFSSAYQQTVAAAGSKDVWVTETGWPVSGPTENLAVASDANAETYWDAVGCDMLFGKVNTFWYTLQDAGSSPSFGVVGSTLSTTPLYNLSCSASSSSTAATSSATSVSKSVASVTTPTTVPTSATSSISENPVPSASLGASTTGSVAASSVAASSVAASSVVASSVAASSVKASSATATAASSVAVSAVTTGSTTSVEDGETLTVYQTTLVTISACTTLGTKVSTTAPASSAISATKATSASASASASACPADISGDYTYPHLIVPISSTSPNTAYGTQYDGTINSTTSTIFNFDIPASYAGKTCSLVFLFPELSALETSSYTFNNEGGIVSHVLGTTATTSTTYNTAGSEVLENGSIASLVSGNSYVISSDSCPAGTTVSFELSATGGLDLEFFEDYNPSPLGLYVRAC